MTVTPTPTNRAESRYRVQPTVAVGIAVAVVYTIILSTIQQLSGIQYDEFFDSAHNTWRGPGPLPRHRVGAPARLRRLGPVGPRLA